ncbi:NIPSNAP family protein [Rubripirellula amarantea]|nr:NIPSNAP family protein [Rubripirellula amarantea]
MNRFASLLLVLGLIPAMLPTSARAESGSQMYEVRSYVLGENGDAAAVDKYLETALLPALARQDIGPVGVFKNAPSDETGSQRFVVVIPIDSPDALVTMNEKVSADADYQKAANEFLSRGPKSPAYARVQSELLVAMDCMKKLVVPEGATANADRVFELRVYESANERLGNLKVEMFNEGEVPIFLDCGIIPIFIGQAVIGPQTPNLTYLTLYPNEEERLESWVKFREHADWKVLSVVPKYQGTVSRIDKFVLVPTSYSQI